MNFNEQRLWLPFDKEINFDKDGFILPHSETKIFSEINHIKCLILLGETNIGKSYALRDAYNQIKNSCSTEEHARFIDLKEYSSTVEIKEKLIELGGKNYKKTTIFIDSLDEYHCKNRFINELVRWLGEYPIGNLHIRIACRSTIWQLHFDDKLDQIFNNNLIKAKHAIEQSIIPLQEKISEYKDEVELKSTEEAVKLKTIAKYRLLPLSLGNIQLITRINNIDENKFINEIKIKNIAPLAMMPGNLSKMLQIYNEKKELPGTKFELYEEYCRVICKEHDKDKINVSYLDVQAKLAIARHIAVLSIFSGCTLIQNDLNEDNVPQGILDIKSIYNNHPFKKLDNIYQDIEQALNTPFFTKKENNKFSWLHQSYPEFLAARYLIDKKIPLKKILNLIIDNTFEERVYPHYQEVAGWLAIMSPEVFSAIAKIDPQVLIKADINNIADCQRNELVENLLYLSNKGIISDNDHTLFEHYKKLYNIKLHHLVKPYIINKNKNTTARKIAIRIAKACNLHVLIPTLIDQILDINNPYEQRVAAASAVSQLKYLGECKSELLAMLSNNKNDDDDEIKGYLLRTLWPEYISTQDLFNFISYPKKENLIGSYLYFLADIIDLLKPRDIPLALNWVYIQNFNKPK